MKIKKRKLLAIVMAAVLVFTLQGTVFAEDLSLEEISAAEIQEPQVEAEPQVNEAKLRMAPAADDGINTWEELKAALAAGGDVVLSGNIEFDGNESVDVQNVVAVDLNGYMIRRTGESNTALFTIKSGGSLTVNDTKGTGGIDSTYPFKIMSDATFILNGGNITSNKGSVVDIYTSVSNVHVGIHGGAMIANADNTMGVRGKQNVSVDITGGTITSATNRLAMYVSGDQDGAIQLNISGGVIENEGQAIQAYSGAVINVSGDAYIHSKSNTGISTQSGYGKVELNVTGGKIETDTGAYAVQVREKSAVNISGGMISGRTAVQVSDQASVNVSGGELDGKNVAIGKASNSAPAITVTGGKFSHDVKEYVPAGMNTEQDADGNFVVKPVTVIYVGGAGANDGNTGVDKDQAVASISKAMELLSAGGTVIVCGTVSLNSDVTIQNIKIERADGFTGSLFTVENAEVTLTNVTVDGKKDVVTAVQFAALFALQENAVLNIAEGAVLTNNAFAAVLLNDASASLNMTGGSINGNESSYDGGGILAYGGTVNLTGGEIAGNRSILAGGGICYLGAGNVTLNGTRITGNHAKCGGGVYVEGLNGTATFTMLSGEITGNQLTEQFEDGDYWMADGAGICAYASDKGQMSLEVLGGTIADNHVTSSQTEETGVGSAISLKSVGGIVFPSMRLGKSPSINGDIYLWDEENAGPVIEIMEDTVLQNPLLIIANWGTEGTTAVRFPAQMDPAEAEALFVSDSENMMLAADGNQLKWLEKVRVSFKTPDNGDTYKVIYVRPGTAIDPTLVPIEGSTEGTVMPPAGYMLANWKSFGEKENWDFSTKVEANDSPMTLLAVWGLKQPTVTVKCDQDTVHIGEKIVLTASAEHEAKNVTYTYQWYRGKKAIDGETKNTLAVTEGGSYSVKVTASDGTLIAAETESAAVTCTVTDHTYGEEWKSDENGHWKECTICKEKSEQGKHSGGKATCKEKALCEICKAPYGKTDPDHHAGEIEVRGKKDATCTTEGYTGDSYCQGCGKKLTNGAVIPKIAHTYGEWKVTKEPTEKEKGEKQRSCTMCGAIEKMEIPVLGHEHRYEKEWKSDDKSHWHECACGEKKDAADHTFVWIIDQKAAGNTVGIKHEECTVCGFKKAAVQIPAPGKIEKPSDQGPDKKPGNTPKPPGIQKPDNSRSAKTGDHSNPAIWIGLLVISGFGLLTVMIYKNRKKNQP